MRSVVYEGIIIHHRRHPIDHRFQYRVAMPLLDLDEIEELCSIHPLWSNERSNFVSYRRSDYLGGGPMPLGQVVREAVEDRLGTRLSGPIAMLAHPRTWGWLFNPVTLYYCFDPTGTRVDALVAEVTNTPWHERHAYVVGRPGTHRFDKALHVSPFFGMDMQYELSYRAPGHSLSLRISTIREGSAVFDAVMHLERREVSRRELSRLVFSHPFMTMRVSAAIYRQAFALRRAGAPVVTHPRCQQRHVLGPEASSRLAEPPRGTTAEGATVLIPTTRVAHA
jgi:uncharacterized protein